jgi:hypothetical protein
MGTTATVLVLHPSGAWIGHVGDTRVYRIRQGTIEQLTFDHSLRWEVARRRHEDPDKVTDIASNAIVRSLGPETTVEVDLEGPHSVQAGDVFLLCSDGLSGLVSDAEMGAIASTLPLKEAANFLVALANLRGGPDNITVILVRVQEFAPAPTCPRLPWWKRLGQGLWRWLATATPAQCARLAVPLAVLTLATLIPVLASWTELPALWRRVLLGSSIVSFVTASALLARGLYLLQKMERHSGESEPEVREQVRINPPQVYRRASCAVDGNLLGRMTQVQQGFAQFAAEIPMALSSRGVPCTQPPASRPVTKRKVGRGFSGATPGSSVAGRSGSPATTSLGSLLAELEWAVTDSVARLVSHRVKHRFTVAIGMLLA